MKKLIAMILSAAMVLCLAVMPAAAQGAEDDALPVAQEVAAQQAQELLLSCTGYAGTAGSSMKKAVAAQKVLAFCAENELAEADGDALERVIMAAYAALSDEQKEELASNMTDIFDLIEAVLGREESAEDYVSVEGMLESAGVKESFDALAAVEGIRAQYEAFKTPMLKALSGFEGLLVSCTGYAGTAGSSLKGAIAACDVLRYCVQNRLALKDPDDMQAQLAAAYASVNDEQREELTENMAYIFGVIESAFGDYASVQGLLDSAGAEAAFSLLLGAEDAYAHYIAFKTAMIPLIDAGE